MIYQKGRIGDGEIWLIQEEETEKLIAVELHAYSMPLRAIFKDGIRTINIVAFRHSTNRHYMPPDWTNGADMTLTVLR